MNTKIRISILDDSEIQQKIILKVLENFPDIEVTVYNRSLEFLKSLEKGLDLAIVDYFIDEFNGIEITKMIQKKSKGILIIGHSIQDQIQVAMDYIEAGAWRYVVMNGKSQEKLSKFIGEACEIIKSDKLFLMEMKKLLKNS